MKKCLASASHRFKPKIKRTVSNEKEQYFTQEFDNWIYCEYCGTVIKVSEKGER